MKFIITAPFQEISKIHPTPHSGMDLAMPEGTTLRSVAEGKIDQVFDYGSRNAGRGVIIDAGHNKFIIYGHMSQVTVHPGQSIHHGDTIGFSGNTGHSTGPHLHFGVREGMHWVDPTAFNDDLQNITGGTYVAGTDTEYPGLIHILAGAIHDHLINSLGGM